MIWERAPWSSSSPYIGGDPKAWAQERRDALRVQVEIYCAHRSGTAELAGRPQAEQAERGARMQEALKKASPLVDDLAASERCSRDQLWLAIGLWPDADRCPFELFAGPDLHKLSPREQRALESGRKAVMQGKWPKRRRGRPEIGEAGRCLTAHRLLTHEQYDLADVARKLYPDLYHDSPAEACRRASDAASKGRRLYCPACRNNSHSLFL